MKRYRNSSFASDSFGTECHWTKAKVKNVVARNNVKFNITAVKELISTALDNVTPQNWQSAIWHIQKVGEVFRHADFGDDDSASEVVIFIIKLSDSDSEFDLEFESDENAWLIKISWNNLTFTIRPMYTQSYFNNKVHVHPVIPQQ